jgi:V/A-type H+-transporting ATPase subunit E
MSERSTLDTAEVTSSGVETLIERLRQEGVSAGRSEGERIVQNAQNQAEEILRKARRQAEEVVAQARREAEQTTSAGEDALRMAARDTVLKMREELGQKLESRVRRLVTEELEDRQLLAQLVLEVVASAVADSGVATARKVEIELPEEVLDPEKLGESPQELTGPLSDLAKQVATASFREGVSFEKLGPGGQGIRVRLVDESIEVDLSDAAIAELLLQHLKPRFRAVMEGVAQ